MKEQPIEKEETFIQGSCEGNVTITNNETIVIRDLTEANFAHCLRLRNIEPLKWQNSFLNQCHRWEVYYFIQV